MTTDELQAIEGRHADDTAYCAAVREVLTLNPERKSEAIAFRRTHEDRGLLLAEVRRLRGEADDLRDENKRLAARLTGGMGGGTIGVEDVAAERLITRWRRRLSNVLDAAGRAIQEAKHHHRGRGQPLDGTGGLSPGLRDALRALEEVTDPGRPFTPDEGLALAQGVAAWVRR